MKCQNCKSEMEKGYLMNHGMVWTNRTGANWGFTKWLIGGTPVFAYRCSKCKSVQLQTEE